VAAGPAFTRTGALRADHTEQLALMAEHLPNDSTHRSRAARRCECLVTEGGPARQPGSLDLALQRVLDLGGVTMTRRPDGEAAVDVSPVVAAATVLTIYLCDLVAGPSEVERETVVNVARWALDTHGEQGD